MKKSYIAPLVHVVEMSVEGGILVASQGGNIDVGMTDEEMGGAEALSQRKGNPWDTEDMWN